MDFRPYGDSAILINFEQKIDPKINAEVIAITQALKKGQIKGLIDCIPAYCSITITYDSLIIDYDRLCEKIKSTVKKLGKQKTNKTRTIKIPVCYEGKCTLDLPEVEQLTKLSKEEIISTHTSTVFQVYMLGFLPGFVYMGSLPDSLNCPRKTKPRLKVPARSVGLAGLQTGIYPSEAPGGWQIIGRTPLKIFDGDKKSPFLFQPGDRVTFNAITTEAYLTMEQQVESGKFNLSDIYG